MKIPQQIILVVKDIWIDNPPNVKFFRTAEEGFTFAGLGVKCSWQKSIKSFLCPMMSRPPFSWRNLLLEEGSYWNPVFKMRDDAIYSADSFEEMILNLQLDGARDVFQIPLSFVKQLEQKKINEVGISNSFNFELKFKCLKDRCTRLI